MKCADTRLETDNEVIHDVLLENIWLRVIEWSDFDCLLALYQNQQVARFLPEPPQTRRELEPLMRQLVESWWLRGFGMWSIRLRDDGRMIGRCGFYYRAKVPAGTPNYELAYLLDDGYWGRGIATLCAAACLAYGFGRRGFDAIFGITRRENVASRRVMEKVGMQSRPLEFYDRMGKCYYEMTRSQFALRDLQMQLLPRALPLKRESTHG